MNPFLKTLGFGPDDRVAIVHADDIGAYQASLPAIEELFAAGLVSSCATMVPCPWFPAVAAWARRAPDADIGVHATLNAEFAACRWGPISTRDPASGLLDDEGYLPYTTAALAAADPTAVAIEHRAQLDRALAAGIDVTHIDSHMGTLFAPAFLPGYMAAGAAARVPNLVPRLDAASGLGRALVGAMADAWPAFQHEVEGQGLPLVDHVTVMPLDRHEGRVADAKALFDTLPAGLSYVILHPALDTPELRAAASRDWRARAADHAAFCSPELRAHVRNIGVQVIGWRTVRDAMRRAGQRGGRRPCPAVAGVPCPQASEHRRTGGLRRSLWNGFQNRPRPGIQALATGRPIRRSVARTTAASSSVSCPSATPMSPTGGRRPSHGAAGTAPWTVLAVYANRGGD